MDKEQKTPVDQARKWLAELRLAKKESEKWVDRSKKIIQRYKDERQGWADNTKRYNILWSNIQTMLPALYGKTPRADVQRRFKDQDPVGRTSAQILERALQYEIDHYGDFDASIKTAVLDRLLPGMGTVWVRFETKEVEEAEATEEPQEAMAQVDMPDYEYECTPVDYVFWQDFRWSPARTWDEVTWVARRVYMTRSAGLERFGEIFNDVPLTHEPIGLDELKNSNLEALDNGDLKKAQVWEIWCKTSESVYWVAEGFDRSLDEKEDPYGLDSFWPCPRPLFATQTSDTLIPVPDYSMYQDQADELDKLTNRIAMLVEACKVVGVYDASQAGVERMLSEGIDNTLIPVDTWAALAEKGGIKGVIDFLPLDQVLTALRECYASREQAKQVIYEITGLSDIIRGASVASETATAQQIKSQYASLRLRRLQTDVAMFASEVLRIKAQMMSDLYAPETLVQMSGIMGTQDAQYVEQAIQLIKTEPARNFRIEVAADSLVEMDEQAEKAARMEFLQAVGGFLQQALPVTQQVPELTPLLAEMLMFGVRSFKGGRAMEAAFDSAMAKITAPKPPQEPQPDPEQIKMQGQMQLEQMRMQLDQQKANQALQIEQQKTALEQQREETRIAFEKWKIEQQEETKLMIAEMNNRSSLKQTAMQINSQVDPEVEELDEQGQPVAKATIQDLISVMSQGIQAIAEAQAQNTQILVDQMTRPKQVIRDANGRVQGVQ